VKIETRPLHEIFPYPANARKIPQSAIDSVAKSLLEFGWQQPIVVDRQGVIVVGHTRRLAALSLGWTEAPVTVFEGTATQARQYRLIKQKPLNKMGLNVMLALPWQPKESAAQESGLAWIAA
jgi:ParB-like chromosome segregation protein Spo0J